MVKADDRARAADELRQRTKQFALRVVRLSKALPKEDEARVIGRQLLRSGTSVGANYRAVCRARSAKEFVSKIGIVVEEADETAFWIELLIAGQIVKAALLSDLLRETNELLAIFAASYHTARRKTRRRPT
jgi:four helix bundle protein